IAALLHVGQDTGHGLLHAGIGLGRPMQPRRQRGIEAGVGGGKAQGLGGEGHVSGGQAGVVTVREKTSIRRRIGSCLSLSAAWLTTRRELISMMRSTSTRLLALRVLPVETRSTMASARPVSGASSMLP